MIKGKDHSSNYNETSAAYKENQGKKPEDYLHATAQDKKNFTEKMEDSWVRIYQADCTFSPKLVTKFKVEALNRPKNVHEELYNKKPEIKTYSNPECTFQPNKRK